MGDISRFVESCVNYALIEKETAGGKAQGDPVLTSPRIPWIPLIQI